VVSNHVTLTAYLVTSSKLFDIYYGIRHKLDMVIPTTTPFQT